MDTFGYNRNLSDLDMLLWADVVGSNLNENLTVDQNLLGDDVVPPPSNQNTATGVHSEDDFNDGQISISYEGTYPSFNLSENLRSLINSSWENSLIVKPFNRSVKRYKLLEHLRNMWSPRGEWELTDLDNDFFAVKFSSSVDMNYVFNEGPWIILGDYLTILKWRPGIHPSLVSNPSTAAWVRFPDLPIEYRHNHKLLSALGNKIGTVIMVDPKTRFAPKRKFARVCVEIDLGKDVLTEFKLAGVRHRVEYEHLKVDGGKVRGVCKVHRGGHRAINRPQSIQPGVSGPAQPIIESETVQVSYGLPVSLHPSNHCIT